MKKIKSIKPLSLALTLAITSFILGMIYSVVSIVTVVNTYSQVPISSVLIYTFISPIGYLVTGFVVGFILALIYNFIIVRLTGGLKIELEE